MFVLNANFLYVGVSGDVDKVGSHVGRSAARRQCVRVEIRRVLRGVGGHVEGHQESPGFQGHHP